MLATVQFHDQHSAAAGEISKIWTYRILSDEFIAIDLAVANHLPERLLGVRLGSSQ
jgi:hypothetical protein